MTPNLLETRMRIEAKINELIDMLDVIDGDCDLEDNGDDEPSLDVQARYSIRGLEYDLEADGDEQDYNGDEGDFSVGLLNGGCGL